MIVVYPFSTVDQDLALKNARWMNELGGCKGHQVLVCYDARCNPETVEAIGQELLKCFDKVFRLEAKLEYDGWPQGANYFFRLSTTWLQNNLQFPYFLWMEPDAIPMQPDWIDMLEAEYLRGRKPFMGDRVDLRETKPEVPLHMSGIGIYENPIYKRAGEAYRAHDVAWDIAAKDQIVPNAFWTKLIEHAWKHPKFTSIDEIGTQIRPECVLFHSSKDGSLIELLRRGRTATPDPIPNMAGQAGSTPVAAKYQPPAGMFQGTPTKENPIGEYVADIFIRTYPGDYGWLDYCLQAVGKYARGFRKIWIMSPAEPSDPLRLLVQGFGGQAEWKLVNDECKDGYLAQQITKLYADMQTDADYILHLDSDTLFTREVTPYSFLDNGKLAWYYTPYPIWYVPPGHTEKKLVHWQPITEKFMGFVQPFEFMRRLPMMIPRWLYPKLREYCHQTHRRVISEYIGAQPLREFSEFNALGALAFCHYHDRFEWINTLQHTMPAPLARQFHSWGGITPDTEKEIQEILHGADNQIPPVVPNDTGLPTEAALAETGPEIPPGPAPVQAISSKEEMRQYIDRLKEYADSSWLNKSAVAQRLVKVGLRKPDPKNKRNRKHASAF